MKLHIKNMVCSRCKIVVKSVFENMGINPVSVDLGEVEINKEEKTPIYWSPVTGGIILVAGIVVLLVSRKK